MLTYAGIAAEILCGIVFAIVVLKSTDPYTRRK